MQIGTIIRKYRLQKNLTQEEVARRLGVTAPAVNKWEKGNSMPILRYSRPLRDYWISLLTRCYHIRIHCLMRRQIESL